MNIEDLGNLAWGAQEFSHGSFRISEQGQSFSSHRFVPMSSHPPSMAFGCIWPLYPLYQEWYRTPQRTREHYSNFEACEIAVTASFPESPLRKGLLLDSNCDMFLPIKSCIFLPAKLSHSSVTLFLGPGVPSSSGRVGPRSPHILPVLSDSNTFSLHFSLCGSSFSWRPAKQWIWEPLWCPIPHCVPSTVLHGCWMFSGE